MVPRPAEPVRPSAWHVCISGFLQREGEPTGLQRLWLELGRLRCPTVCVELREWNADWKAMAEQIWVTSDPSPTVHVYAYSWGAGYGFRQLARELGKRGVAVQKAVLADPVFRSITLVGRWLALIPGPVIRIPENVLEVWSTRQDVSWPRAHRLVADSPDTKIHPPRRRRHSHPYMDDDLVFHSLALRAAGIQVDPADAFGHSDLDAEGPP